MTDKNIGIKNETLEKLISAFEEHVESSIELDQENEKGNWISGEYSYFVEEEDLSLDGLELDEDLEEALLKSSLNVEDVAKKAVKEGYIVFDYESQSSPFQYGGKAINEVRVIDNGGDKEVEIDREFINGILSDQDKLKENVSKKDFTDHVEFHIGRCDDLESLYDLLRGDKSATITYNSDYDIIRVLIDTDCNEKLIEWIKEHPRKVSKDKTKKISMEEYQEMERYNYGFCLHCGEINDSFHEPDARDYKCDYCEEEASYGASEAFVMGALELIEDKDCA